MPVNFTSLNRLGHAGPVLLVPKHVLFQPSRNVCPDITWSILSVFSVLLTVKPVQTLTLAPSAILDTISPLNKHVHSVRLHTVQVVTSLEPVLYAQIVGMEPAVISSVL